MLDTFFTPTHVNTIVHLVAALAAGGLIGIERSFHGRPAGFRTHTLVCLASAVLMILTVQTPEWMPGGSDRLDPTRMAQGIMTGIGFLGAGVIYKEAITVRGLTTAASVWITAAIGILMGAGLFFPGILSTIMVISILAFFPKIERLIPKQTFVHCTLTFDRGNCLTEEELKELGQKFGFHVGTLTYHANGDNTFEYRMVLRSYDYKDSSRLAQHLNQDPNVRSFNLAPTGD
jgi:putative Mg2+ transporter-C (MgtC) family protein